MLSIFYSLVDDSNAKLKFHEVDLLAPINGPDKVLCIGMNYNDHALHQNKKVPKEPVVFNKFPSSLVGPSDDIPFPEVTKVNISSNMTKNTQLPGQFLIHFSGARLGSGTCCCHR